MTKSATVGRIRNRGVSFCVAHGHAGRVDGRGPVRVISAEEEIAILGGRAAVDSRQCGICHFGDFVHMWQPISTAPSGRDLQLAVLDANGIHALVFPCRRALDGWVKTQTRTRIEVWPTHWRDWEHAARDCAAVAQHPE